MEGRMRGKILSWNRVLIAGLLLFQAAAAVAQTGNAGPLIPPDRIITGYTLPPDKLAKATALYTVQNRLLIADAVFGFALLFAFLYGRVGPRIRDLAARATSRERIRGFIYVPIFLLVLLVLQLPLEMYSHHLSLSYNLSIQRWGSWFGDWGKNLLLEILIGTAAICGAYALMRRSPRRWWLWFWALSVPCVLFIFFLSPILIDPMFNHFDPLEQRHPGLVQEIEKVVHAGGLTIPRSQIFEMRASDKVNTFSAYVTGIGASKRIVVWDNTVKNLTVPQTLYVFGHEMGHYVLNHIWKQLAIIALFLLAAFYLGARFGEWLVRIRGPQWGIRGLSDWASLSLMILILSLFVFITQPVTNGVSRYFEHRADQYGLEVIHGIVPDANQAAAQAFQALGENTYSYPDPNRWLVFWTYDHPAIPDRVQFVLHYPVPR
jgi:STE24 endopeptidase